MSLPRLYLITDRVQARRAIGSLPRAVEAAVDAGVRMIQYRDKDLSARERLELGEQLLAHPSDDVRWLVNDRADLAALLGADGLHRPGDGLPIDRIHDLLDDPIVGVSTHDLEEARAAEAAGAEFVTLSPIYETDSKPGYGPPLGLEMLAEVVDQLELPVYALAGITPERARACREVGAYGIAVMSGIMGSTRPADAARRYLQAV